MSYIHVVSMEMVLCDFLEIVLCWLLWRLAVCDAFGVKKVDFLDHAMAVKD